MVQLFSILKSLVLLTNVLQIVECFNCNNFSTSRSGNSRRIKQRYPLYMQNYNNDDHQSTNQQNNEMNRRNAFIRLTQKSTSLASIFTIISSSSSFSTPSPANAADDRLFKPNPLTNPVLEKIRIWEQAEADDIKYGGELAAPGSPKGQEAYAKLLVPILRIQMDLAKVDELVHVDNGIGLDDAMKIMNQPYFEKVQFKKIFNAFADNIYYSDPDRANAYLGGGAIPKNEQSIAYLIRNDILTNIENLQAEVAYLIKEKKANNPLEVDDLYLYAKTCNDDMVKYLDLVPPKELKLASEMISK